MEKSIIDELFNARCDDFENKILKNDKQCYKDLDIITNTFEEILKIVPEDINEITTKKFETIYLNILNFSTSWNKKYYRLGIKDGIKLKQELKTNLKKRKENEENFIIDYESDFNDFFENYKAKILLKNKEYSNIINEISNILEKHPRLRDFYEDNEINCFSNNELEALLRFIDLNETKNSIEVRTAFSLGMAQENII